MNLQDVFDFINFIINKEQSGKYITPREFTLLLRNASLVFFKRYYDVPEEYQVGQPLSRIQWELTTAAKKKLKRFMAISDTLPDSDGYLTSPSNMFYPDYFSTSTGVGRFVKGYEFDSILTNPVTFPTEKRAIATERSNTVIEFAPKDLSVLNFHYLRIPNEPTYDFYIDADDNIVYLRPDETSPSTGATPANKASESVELDWDIECIWDIIQIILENVGIAINRGEVIQYANTKQTKGI